MDDVDRIMAVMDAAFDPQWGEAWNRRQIESSLTLPTTHYFLVDETGKIPANTSPAAGFCMSRAAPGEEELLLIGVIPAARKRGIGKQLLTRLAQDARGRGAEKLFLEMRENNPARSLYEAEGFAPIGRRKDYYTLKDGKRIDAITFARVL